MTIYLANKIQRFLDDEDGTTAVEYAVMLSVIIISCIAAILGTGDMQESLWFDTADKIDTVLPGGP